MNEKQNSKCNYGYDAGCYCGKKPIKIIKVFYEDFEDGMEIHSDKMFLCKEHYEEWKKDHGQGWSWESSVNSRTP